MLTAIILIGVLVAALVLCVLVHDQHEGVQDTRHETLKYNYQSLQRDHGALRKEFDALTEHLKVHVVEEPAARAKMRVLDFNK